MSFILQDGCYSGSPPRFLIFKGNSSSIWRPADLVQYGGQLLSFNMATSWSRSIWRPAALVQYGDQLLSFNMATSCQGRETSSDVILLLGKTLCKNGVLINILFHTKYILNIYYYSTTIYMIHKIIILEEDIKHDTSMKNEINLLLSLMNGRTMEN